LAAPTRKDVQQELAAFEEACRGAGLKLTHQRLEIYRELMQAVDHPSVETLFQRVRRRIPTISLDTVYRTLSMLEQYDLIRRIQTYGAFSRFEKQFRRHHHLFCRKCQELTDVAWEALENLPLPPEMADWGSVEEKNLLIEGVCRKCFRGKNGR